MAAPYKAMNQFGEERDIGAESGEREGARKKLYSVIILLSIYLSFEKGPLVLDALKGRGGA